MVGCAYLYFEKHVFVEHPNAHLGSALASTRNACAVKHTWFWFLVVWDLWRTPWAPKWALLPKTVLLLGAPGVPTGLLMGQSTRYGYGSSR